jgi:hypothetical protein
LLTTTEDLLLFVADDLLSASLSGSSSGGGRGGGPVWDSSVPGLGGRGGRGGMGGFRVASMTQRRHMKEEKMARKMSRARAMTRGGMWSTDPSASGLNAGAAGLSGGSSGWERAVVSIGCRAGKWWAIS